MVLLVSVLMVSPVVATAAYYDSPLTADANTVALYHFDGSLADSGPLGLDLSGSGGWSYESGSSYEWLPNSDPAFVTSWFSGGFTGTLTPGISLPAATNWSIEGWIAVRPKDNGTMCIMAQNGGFALEHDNRNANRIRLYAGNGSWDGAITGAELFTTTSFNYNEWHHIKFQHTGTALQLIVDGVVEVDYAYTGPIGGGGALCLGGWNFGAGGYNGFFDDVRIQQNVVPEPTTLGLLALGCVGFLRRRK